MKKLNMRVIKKQMVALGLAATMILSMGMPAYARSINDAGAVGWKYDSNEITSLYNYYLPTDSWLGSYDVGINGNEYQLTISRIPKEGAEEWMVEACQIPDGKGYSNAAWTGWVYPDSAHGLSVTDDNGMVASVLNWNGDKTNPDVHLVIAWDPDTDQIYLQAIPLRDIDSLMAHAFPDVPGVAAFAPQSTDPDGPVMVYKKISDAYQLLEGSPSDNGGMYWIGKGWTDGTNMVDEPWWTSGTESAGNGTG